MRRTYFYAVTGAVALGLVALLTMFGPVFAQPPAQSNGLAIGQPSEGASCHAEGGAASEDHMLGPLAKALDMEESALIAELDAGKSLGDIAKSRGLDDVQLAALLKEAIRNVVHQHVQDGLLTEDEADQMVEHMDATGADHLGAMLDGEMPLDMMDGQHHDGMMDGQHDGMMDGQGHDSMMGGQDTGRMDAAPDAEDYSSSSCHPDDMPTGGLL